MSISVGSVLPTTMIVIDFFFINTVFQIEEVSFSCCLLRDFVFIWMIIKIINVISISAEIIIWLMIFLLYAANVMKYIALFSNIDPYLLSWNKYFLFMIYYSFLYWWIHANILINIFHMFLGDFSLWFSHLEMFLSLLSLSELCWLEKN